MQFYAPMREQIEADRNLLQQLITRVTMANVGPSRLVRERIIRPCCSISVCQQIASAVSSLCSVVGPAVSKPSIESWHSLKNTTQQLTSFSGGTAGPSPMSIAVTRSCGGSATSNRLVFWNICRKGGNLDAKVVSISNSRIQRPYYESFLNGTLDFEVCSMRCLRLRWRSSRSVRNNSIHTRNSGGVQNRRIWLLNGSTSSVVWN